jgi:hypothetical protein
VTVSVAQRWPRDEAELTLANLKALAAVFMSGLVQSSRRSPLTHTALASAFAWVSEIRAICVIGMTSLGSHSNEVCDPRKLKPEPFQDAASGTKIVEVDGSSSVGAEAARRTIEPPDDFVRIMLSRECDDHEVPSYIRNLSDTVGSSIIVNFLQLLMSRSYNGLVFWEILTWRYFRSSQFQ